MQQVVRRYYESINSSGKNHIHQELSGFNLVKLHCDGPLIQGSIAPEFKSIVFPNFKLSCNLRDSCCALKDGSVIEIKNFDFSLESNDNVVIGLEYMEKSDFFDIPVSSSLLNIICVNNLGETKFWSVKEISHKLVRVPYNHGFIVFPLVHTQRN